MDDKRQGYDEKSALGMMAEIGRLLLVLLLKCIVRGLRTVRRGLWRVVKLFCKGLLRLIDGIDTCATALSRFWNDHSTQEKLRRVRQVLSAAWRGTVLGCTWMAVHTWRGLCWLGTHTWKTGKWLAVWGARGVWLFCQGVVWSVVHLRQAMGLAWRGIVRGARAIARAGAWLWRHVRSAACAFHHFLRRLYDAWLHFRRTKGFKGLLIDCGLWLKRAIDDMMEEQDGAVERATVDETSDNDSPMEDDPELLFKGEVPNEGQRVHTFGRGFYFALRRIVEDD